MFIRKDQVYVGRITGAKFKVIGVAIDANLPLEASKNIVVFECLIGGTLFVLPSKDFTERFRQKED